ncbi:glycosyl hydrolase [Propioniciclava soli]|uniref:glycosyl hydrolase n=1 Tax=Propioniciclava soli TaxID=2775081 RepID=UPI001E51D809
MAPLTPESPGLAALRAGFADPPRAAAPMMRWWWFGPDITTEGVERDLTAMAEAGLGGAEIAFVYPMRVLEEEAPFLSPRFLAALDHAVRFGAALGLRMDLTLGSGWSFGGPHITDDLAARTLVWERRLLPPGAHRVPVSPTFPGDDVVGGYVLPLEGPATPVHLPVVDGHLDVPDTPGPRQLLLATTRRTGQNVKRAAAGAEGPVLDHYDAEAVRTHLRAVGDVLLDAVDASLLGAVFCDSLEVYDANWTPALPAEFAARRGYALVPRLAELVVDTPGSDAFRADVHRTLTELYEEHFVDVVCAWADDRGVAFRLQGYGVPPASVSSYRDVAMIEGEGWGWRELTSAKWASSAAHERGTPVVSAEAWTWVNSPSFRATPLDLASEAHEHLLAGVNHIVGHGWPHSPADAPGLGWIFYASGALDDRNAWWPAAPALWRYLARLGWLLRQGEPVREVTLFVPGHDVYAQLAPELDLFRAVRRHVGVELTAALRTAGHDYVLVDDAVLDAAPRPRPVIVVAGTTDARAEAWLAERAAAGSRVVRAAEVVADPDLVGDPDVGIEGGEGDVGAVHRRIDGVDVWFVANTGPHESRVRVRPPDAAPGLERWDAHTGRVSATWQTPFADLALAPYEAAVLVGSSAPATRLTLADWTLRAGVHGPAARERAVTLPHVWEDDPALARFCGSVTYTATVALDAAPARAELDFGSSAPSDGAFAGDSGLPSFRAAVEPPVGAVVQVRVNGTDCGVLWAPPFRLDLTDALRAGANELTLVVSSTSAHALADDTHLAEAVAAVTRRYGRRFVLQDLDQADAGVRSGLLATPTLRLS